ncbi:hypothetical protein FOL47_005485, partial [Perkinsus chesapeaki]
SLLLSIAQSGVIHGDFNEFNLLIRTVRIDPLDELSEVEDYEVYVIDFPQVLSVEHPDAKRIFERDVNCIATYFAKNHKYVVDTVPSFEEDVLPVYRAKTKVEGINLDSVLSEGEDKLLMDSCAAFAELDEEECPELTEADESLESLLAELQNDTVANKESAGEGKEEDDAEADEDQGSTASEWEDREEKRRVIKSQNHVLRKQRRKPQEKDVRAKVNRQLRTKNKAKPNVQKSRDARQNQREIKESSSLGSSIPSVSSLNQSSTQPSNDNITNDTNAVTRRSTIPRVYGGKPALPKTLAINTSRFAGIHRGRTSLSSFTPRETTTNGRSRLEVAGIVQPLAMRRASTLVYERPSFEAPTSRAVRGCPLLERRRQGTQRTDDNTSKHHRKQRGSLEERCDEGRLPRLDDQKQSSTSTNQGKEAAHTNDMVKESVRRTRSVGRSWTYTDTDIPFSKNRAAILSALAWEEGSDSLAPGHILSYDDAIQHVEGTCYSLVLCAGNNHSAIERMMKANRPWWRVVVTSQASYSEFCYSMFNLKWKQSLPNATETLRRMANAHDLGGTAICQPQLVNYFGGCHELCTKAALLRNLARYCAEVDINLWEIVPVSIIVSLKRIDYVGPMATPFGIEDFLLATEIMTKVRSRGGSTEVKNERLSNKNRDINVLVPSSLCVGTNRFLLPTDHSPTVSRLVTSRSSDVSSLPSNLTICYSMPASFVPESGDIDPQWMLKPAALSRGRGIKVIRTPAELRQAVFKNNGPHHRLLRRGVIPEFVDMPGDLRRARSMSVEPVIKAKRKQSSTIREQSKADTKIEQDIAVRSRSDSVASTAASSSSSPKNDGENTSVEGGQVARNDKSAAGDTQKCSSSKGGNNKANKGTPTDWVLQKYIDRPMLINNRKFDIRMWVVLTPTLHAYCYREGYIRTASVSSYPPLRIQAALWQVPYDASRRDGEGDKMMHLCNNAIQKHGANYGQFEDGNQMSFDELQAYADANAGNPGCPAKLDVHGSMRLAMYRAMAVSLHATLKQFRSPNSNSFQIFGYDFMIDENGGVWLIEVNSNPCLEESSALLKDYVPDMLNGVFSFCVDPYARPKGSAASYRSDWRKLCSSSSEGSVRGKFDLICCGNTAHSGVVGVKDAVKARASRDAAGPLARMPGRQLDASFTCQWCHQVPNTFTDGNQQQNTRKLRARSRSVVR